MYQESYEDYIRSILGYPTTNQNMYQMQPITNYRNNETDKSLEACYPEIYKVVYPMVNKACTTNSRPVTPELIDELTDEIYSSLETDNNGINININLSNEVQNHTNSSQTSNAKKQVENRSTGTENRAESRTEDRQFRNRGLQDLIRILLIRELLGRPGGSNRPPMPPPRPPRPRPPFPGERPPMGGGRPPMLPRYGDEFIDIYE